MQESTKANFYDLVSQLNELFWKEHTNDELEHNDLMNLLGIVEFMACKVENTIKPIEHNTNMLERSQKSIDETTYRIDRYSILQEAIANYTIETDEGTQLLQIRLERSKAFNQGYEY